MTLNELEMKVMAMDSLMTCLGFYWNGSSYSGHGGHNTYDIGSKLRPKLAEMFIPPDKTKEFNDLVDNYYKEDIQILNELIKEYKQRSDNNR